MNNPNLLFNILFLKREFVFVDSTLNCHICRISSARQKQHLFQKVHTQLTESSIPLLKFMAIVLLAFVSTRKIKNQNFIVVLRKLSRSCINTHFHHASV